MTALEATMRTIGQNVQPHCLTLIETTVAPGTTEFVAWPIMKKAFAARGIESEPLLAHSFERVMPGREYVSSIRDFWRVCSGCNAEARSAGREVPPRGAQHRAIPADGDGSADRVGDHEDRRELVPGDDPGVPERMEPVRRAERRRSDQGHQGDQDAADAQQHDLPRPRHRRLLPAEGRRPGLLGLQAHPRLRGRRRGVQDQPRRPSTSTTPGRCTWPN